MAIPKEHLLIYKINLHLYKRVQKSEYTRKLWKMLDKS